MEKKKKFPTMWDEIPKTGLDYSQKLEKTYVEVPPYAKNEKGEFINNSSVPIEVEGEPFDVDAYIQSFKDDVDIYKILEKAFLSGDASLLNRNMAGAYGDISNIPDNFNDIQNQFGDSVEALAGLDQNIVSDIVNSEKNVNDIVEQINKKDVVDNNNTTDNGGQKNEN